MSKKRIVCCLLAATLTAPLIQVNSLQLNSETEQLTENVEVLDLRNYEFNEMQKKLDVEIQKIKAEQLKIQQEQERLAEEERLRQEELERQRLAEEETNRVVTYNPYNLLEPSNINREEAYQVLEGTALQTLANGYVYMEEVYGINALFLMAISAYESGWGTSYLAMNNNNLGGIKANDGSWAYFSDWFECISYKADLLYNQYLSPNGAYYNGTSAWNINARYCEESVWADNINTIAYELLNNIHNK